MSAISELNVDDFMQALEPLIRRIVREELAEAVKNTPDLFYLQENTPVYRDMQDILQRKAMANIRLHNHTEVWGE